MKFRLLKSQNNKSPKIQSISLIQVQPQSLNNLRFKPQRFHHRKRRQNLINIMLLIKHQLKYHWWIEANQIQMISSTSRNWSQPPKKLMSMSNSSAISISMEQSKQMTRNRYLIPMHSIVSLNQALISTNIKRSSILLHKSMSNKLITLSKRFLKCLLLHQPKLQNQALSIKLNRKPEPHLNKINILNHLQSKRRAWNPRILKFQLRNNILLKKSTR